MKISHSQVSKYLACPRMYKYHYRDKLRPDTTSSALLFGDAMDKALNSFLLEKKTVDEAYEEFLQHWTTGSINKLL